MRHTRFGGIVITLLVCGSWATRAAAQDELILEISAARSDSIDLQPVPPAPEDAPIVPAPDSIARSEYEETPTQLPSCQTCNSCERCRLCFWDRFRCSKFCERMRRIHERLGGCCRKPKPDPLGTLMNAHINRYVTRGREARMIFYQYDFVGDTADLNRAGRKKLKQVGGWLPKSFAPVIIEQSNAQTDLDNARRMSVLKQFSAMSFPIPDERVIVGSPISRGIGSNEARLIFRNQINQTARRGVSQSGGGGGAGRQQVPSFGTNQGGSGGSVGQQ